MTEVIATPGTVNPVGRSLAQQFDVSEDTISMIINWRTWKHVA